MFGGFHRNPTDLKRTEVIRVRMPDNGIGRLVPDGILNNYKLGVTDVGYGKTSTQVDSRLDGFRGVRRPGAMVGLGRNHCAGTMGRRLANIRGVSGPGAICGADLRRT